MQSISLIDSFCWMQHLKVCIRPKKLHSTYKSSHSTNIKSNAIIQKHKVCICVITHSTYQKSNASLESRIRLLRCQIRYLLIAFDCWKVQCDILKSHSTNYFFSNSTLSMCKSTFGAWEYRSNSLSRMRTNNISIWLLKGRMRHREVTFDILMSNATLCKWGKSIW